MTTPQIQSAFDVAQWVLDTVKQALEDCSREAISTAYAGVGEIVWDDCCGSLIVVPERVYRCQTFPQEATDVEICFGGTLAIPISVLLVRCVPQPDDLGNPPPPAVLQAAHKAFLEDAAVVYNAVTSELPDGWQRANVTQSFVGPEGACIGVETRVILGFEQDRFAICLPC